MAHRAEVEAEAEAEVEVEVEAEAEVEVEVQQEAKADSASGEVGGAEEEGGEVVAHPHEHHSCPNQSYSHSHYRRRCHSRSPHPSSATVAARQPFLCLQLAAVLCVCVAGSHQMTSGNAKEEDIVYDHKLRKEFAPPLIVSL